MKQEQRELLLKDFCARLPYGVKAIGNYSTNTCCSIVNTIEGILYNNHVVIDGCNFDISNIKLYLFPLSSMSEEQKQYLKNRFCYDWDGEPYELWKYQIEIGDADELIDWFNKNHFDYRNLIEKGLAIDATGKNIY